MIEKVGIEVFKVEDGSVKAKFEVGIRNIGEFRRMDNEVFEREAV